MAPVALCRVVKDKSHAAKSIARISDATLAPVGHYCGVVHFTPGSSLLSAFRVSHQRPNPLTHVKPQPGALATTQEIEQHMSKMSGAK
jgi:hypothetical protein